MGGVAQGAEIFLIRILSRIFQTFKIEKKEKKKGGEKINMNYAGRNAARSPFRQSKNLT